MISLLRGNKYKIEKSVITIFQHFCELYKTICFRQEIGEPKRILVIPRPQHVEV